MTTEEMEKRIIDLENKQTLQSKELLRIRALVVETSILVCEEILEIKKTLIEGENKK